MKTPKRNMKKGDRIKHKYLGKGTFIRMSKIVLVKWDKTPEVRYNMGENPCTVSIKELRKLTKEQ